MKKTLLATALLLGLTCSSCLGPDNLHRSLRNWNATVSDQDWLNEVIFLGMTIIPVYGFAMLGDIVVVNTIGYWSGDYPCKDPGAFPGFTK